MQTELPTVETSFAVCKFCGEKIEAKSKSAVFCSDACRLRWFRFKHRVVLAAESAEKAIKELEYFLEYKETTYQAAEYLQGMAVRIDAIIERLAASPLDWLK